MLSTFLSSGRHQLLEACIHDYTQDCRAAALEAQSDEAQLYFSHLADASDSLLSAVADATLIQLLSLEPEGPSDEDIERDNHSKNPFRINRRPWPKP